MLLLGLTIPSSVQLTPTATVPVSALWLAASQVLWAVHPAWEAPAPRGAAGASSAATHWPAFLARVFPSDTLSCLHTTFSRPACHSWPHSAPTSDSSPPSPCCAAAVPVARSRSGGAPAVQRRRGGRPPRGRLGRARAPVLRARLRRVRARRGAARAAGVQPRHQRGAQKPHSSRQRTRFSCRGSESSTTPRLDSFPCLPPLNFRPHHPQRFDLVIAIARGALLRGRRGRGSSPAGTPAAFVLASHLLASAAMAAFSLAFALCVATGIARALNGRPGPNPRAEDSPTPLPPLGAARGGFCVFKPHGFNGGKGQFPLPPLQLSGEAEIVRALARAGGLPAAASLAAVGVNLGAVMAAATGYDSDANDSTGSEDSEFAHDEFPAATSDTSFSEAAAGSGAPDLISVLSGMGRRRAERRLQRALLLADAATPTSAAIEREQQQEEEEVEEREVKKNSKHDAPPRSPPPLGPSSWRFCCVAVAPFSPGWAALITFPAARVALPWCAPPHSPELPVKPLLDNLLTAAPSWIRYSSANRVVA